MTFEEQILQNMLENPETCKRDFENITNLINNSDLNYKGRCVQTLALPKFIENALYDYIKAFIFNCFSIFNKVINNYFIDENYRKLFEFSPLLEELILSTQKEMRFIPMTRIDFFLNEKTREMKLCEINTDGTSAMNEDRILGDYLEHNSILNKFLADKKYSRFELFDSWAKEFLSIYRNIKGNKALPNVAIIDFLDKATINEFKQFQKAFINQGINCEICDICDLKYENGILLTPSNMQIDAVYRRAVTADIMENLDEVSDFIEAVKDNAVLPVGGFCTQIIHSKNIFLILHLPQTFSFLEDSEIKFIKNHVPKTYKLTNQTALSESVIDNKDNWLIKPRDSYGSFGVYAGQNCDKDTWERLINENCDNDYLVQEFILPYRTPNIDICEFPYAIKDYANITGIFCYNQKPYGVYSRLAKGVVISSKLDEKSIPTLLI